MFSFFSGIIKGFFLIKIGIILQYFKKEGHHLNLKPLFDFE